MSLLDNGLKYHIPHVIYEKVNMDPEVKAADKIYCKVIEGAISDLESRNPVDASVIALTSRIIDAAYRAGLADGLKLHQELRGNSLEAISTAKLNKSHVDQRRIVHD